MVGQNQSAKTILARLRDAGIVNPRRMKVGMWAKRHGGNLGGQSNKRSGDPMFRVRLLWKNRTPCLPLRRIAQFFFLWCQYADLTGRFDLAALLEGAKPP